MSIKLTRQSSVESERPVTVVTVSVLLIMKTEGIVVVLLRGAVNRGLTDISVDTDVVGSSGGRRECRACCSTCNCSSRVYHGLSICPINMSSLTI